MQTIPRLDPEQAGEASKELFDAIRRQMGGVPNIFSTMGHSPAVLKGYLDFSAALAEGELSAQLREQIALACAGANGCDYCASAHSALGKMAGLKPDELTLNLAGRSSDPQVDVVLEFVRKVVIQRAHLDADDVSALRKAGLGDAHIVEVIGQIAVNLFTNYFNHIASTDVDFPIVRTEVALAA
jgi:uncharacterized peroxidase-related enzyme